MADVPAGVAAVPGVAALPGGSASSLVAVNVDPAEADPGRLTPQRVSECDCHHGRQGAGGSRGFRRRSRKTSAHLAVCAGDDADHDGCGKLGGDKDRLTNERAVRSDSGTPRPRAGAVAPPARSCRWRRGHRWPLRWWSALRCSWRRGCRARPSPSRWSASAPWWLVSPRSSGLPGRRGEIPSNRDVARFIEERDASLDERLVSAVDVATTARTHRPALAAAMIRDAAKAAAHVDATLIVPGDILRRRATRAAIACAILLATLFAARHTARQAYDAVALMLFPSHIVLEVTPGNTRVQAGTPSR